MDAQVKDLKNTAQVTAEDLQVRLLLFSAVVSLLQHLWPCWMRRSFDQSLMVAPHQPTESTG